MKRDRAYCRWQHARTIRRKSALLKRIGGESYVYAWTRGEPERLGKGKIHCSCRMCGKKSYDRPSHRDNKRLEEFCYSVGSFLLPIQEADDFFYMRGEKLPI